MRWFVVLAWLSGCAGEASSCLEVARACHEADELVVDEAVQECHEVGHGVDEAACEAVLESCIATCDAAVAASSTK